MKIVILGEDNRFMNELKALVENGISYASVVVCFDNTDFFDKIKFANVDVFLTVINNRNFKTCFQVADILIGKRTHIKIGFLYDYLLEDWIDQVNRRNIHLIDKKSLEIIRDIRKVISGKFVKYKAEKNLTLKEADVLQLLSKDMTLKEMGGELDMSPKTVGTHRAKVYAKLGVSSQGAAVRRGIELGIISIDYVEVAKEFL